MNRRSIPALCLAGLLAGCASDEPIPDTPVCHDETRAQVEPGDPVPEGLEARDEGELRVYFVSADPPVPDVGPNVWSLLVTDAAGTPQSGCTATVVPWMVDHDHGIPGQPTWVESTTEVGTYTAAGIDWNMPGYWEVTIQDLSCGDLGPEDPLFGLCASN